MKYISILVTLFISVSGFTQNVAINSTGALPDSSAALDISASDKGFLIPRVALAATNLTSPVTNPSTSLLVYNTSSSGFGDTRVFPGFYYWDGGLWRKAFVNKVYAGKINVGDISSSASPVPSVEGYFTSASRSACNSDNCITVNFPALPSTNYAVLTTYSIQTGINPNTAGSNSNVEFGNDMHPVFIYDKTNSSFRIYIEEYTGETNRIAIDAVLVTY